MEPSRWGMSGDCRIIINTERLIVLGECHALCTLNTSFVDFEKSRCIAAATKKEKKVVLIQLSILSQMAVRSNCRCYHIPPMEFLLARLLCL